MYSSCELFKFAVLNMIRMHLPGVIKYIVVFVVSVIAADCAVAQDPYHDYIAEYSGMAVEQQALHGIPRQSRSRRDCSERGGTQFACGAG